MSPVVKKAVLNATLKGSRLLAQAHALSSPADLLEPAAGSVRFVLWHQSHTGAWPYAANDARTWADNFTRATCSKALTPSVSIPPTHPSRRHWRRDGAAPRDHFFSADLTPKYYDNRSDPLDATACAQAIITLCTFGDPGEATNRSRAVSRCPQQLQWVFRLSAA